jgi:hypothetical protein
MENGEFRRPLNDEEREKLRDGGMSDYNIGKCKADENGKIYLRTDNERLEGQTGKTGVIYERKTVMVNGVEVEGVFPKFDSRFDAYLPESLLQSSDATQEKECNKQLKDAVENDPEFASQFTDVQLEQIKNEETPDGYTWHHNEETGKMELVNSDDHRRANTAHTGGKSIWGGGQENR